MIFLCFMLVFNYISEIGCDKYAFESNNSPMFTNNVVWDNQNKSIVLEFNAFSLGYEGGLHPKRALVALKELESYKFVDTTKIEGVDRKLIIEYTFLWECKNSVILKFHNLIYQDVEQQMFDKYYRIPKKQ